MSTVWEYKLVKNRDETSLSKIKLLPKMEIRIPKDQTFTTPEKIGNFLIETPQIQIGEEIGEAFYELCFDNEMHLIAIFELFRGPEDACSISTKQIALGALLSGAHGVILAHNHPSGSIEISEEDKIVTEKAKNALELLDIDLLDHLIIGDMQYRSIILYNKEETQNTSLIE